MQMKKGNAIILALILVALSSIAITSMIPRESSINKEQNKQLLQSELNHLARMGLESAIDLLRNLATSNANYPSPPSPGKNFFYDWGIYSEAVDADKKIFDSCIISASVAQPSGAAIRLSPTYKHGNNNLRLISINTSTNQWRIISCAWNQNLPSIASYSSNLDYPIPYTSSRGVISSLKRNSN